MILCGTVVTPGKVIPQGWVAIKQGEIDSISEIPPTSAVCPVVDTKGILFPGFVDLHNHPAYNIFERWTYCGKFKNRYEWRTLQEYLKRIRNPGRAIQQKDDPTFCDLDTYVEVKALVGGTTSITGISARRPPFSQVPDCVAGLARNLDWASGFYESGVGHERLANIIGVSYDDLQKDDAQRITERLADNDLDLLLVHLAEGSPSDVESTLEFLALKGRGFLGDHTAIIHGIALCADDFREMHAAGTALIWSPRSNLELYGCTTDIISAHRQGVSIALAPDWSPTGSSNLLAELRYASRFSRERLSGFLSDRMLFEMATSIPARIARIDDEVGSLQQGLKADIMVLRGDTSQPFAALAQAQPRNVHLVLVGGVALYGSRELISQFNVGLEAVNVDGVERCLNSGVLSGKRFSDVRQRLEAALKAIDPELRLAPLCEGDHQ